MIIDPDFIVLFSLAFSYDNKYLAACSKLGRLFVWDVQTLNKKLKPFILNISPKSPLYCLLTVRNILLLGGTKGLIAYHWEQIKQGRFSKSLWRLKNINNKLNSEKINSNFEVNAMRINNKNQLFIASGINVMFQIDLETGKLVREFFGHSNYLNDISLQNESIATASEDGTLRIWDSRQSTSVSTLDPTTGRASNFSTSSHNSWASCVDFHKEQQLLLSGTSFGKQLALWELRKSMIFKSMPCGAIPQVCYLNSDLSCYSGGNQNIVQLWKRNYNNLYDVHNFPSNIQSIWSLMPLKESLIVAGTSPSVDIFIKPFSSPKKLRI